MSILVPVNQAMLDLYRWDASGYLVQAIDLHNELFNVIGYLDLMHADIYGNTNGVLTGLNVTGSTPNMTFSISTGRCTAIGGTKLIGLITPGGINTGQPTSFTVSLTNGTGMSGSQTRIDLICAQYQETVYQDTNNADHIIEGIGLVVIQGTPGTPGAAPTLPDNTYVALAAVTVHTGDTTSAQASIDTTAAGLRYNFPSLVSLLSTFNGANSVSLQGASPTPQVGNGGVSNVSVHGFIHSDQFLEVPAITTPAAPAAGTYRIYYKSDGNRYVYDPIYGEQLDIPVGIPTPWLSGTLPSGCFWCDGSIFSTISYARIAAITAGAYKTGGEGVNQDRIIDLRGRTLFGPDNFGSTGAANRLPGIVKGAFGGLQTIIQTLAQLAAHGHSDSSHGHGFNDDGHGHGTTDPNHVHTQSSGGFAVLLPNDPNSDWSSGGGSQYSSPLSTPAATTGVTVNAAATGASVANGNANITSSGSSSPMNVMNPYTVTAGYIIRY